eukprot:gene4039-20214_t
MIIYALSAAHRIVDLNLMAAATEIDVCTVCLNELGKPQDRNLIVGKTRIIDDLNNLPLKVHLTSDYICRSCLALVKKHKNLKQQLWDLEKALDALVNVRTTAFEETYLAEKGEGSFAVRSSTPKKATNVLVPENAGAVSGPSSSCNATALGGSTRVTITVQRPSKTKQKSLEGGLASIGKMLCRGTLSQIARSIWRCKPIRKDLVKEIAGEINKECIQMCRKSEPSCLRRTGPEDIASFSFEMLSKELDEHAPITKTIMMAASICKEKKGDDENWINAVCVAASILLRNRSQQMNAFQLILSIILKHCGFLGIMGRLQILRLMPSHTQFYRKLQAYGKVHDKILKDIIRNESERLESTTMREGCSLQEKNKSTVSRIEKHKLSQKEENDNENKIKAVKRIRESLQTIEDGNDNGSFEPPISAFAKHKALRLKTIPVISEPEVIVSEKASEVVLKTNVVKEPLNIRCDTGRKIVLDNIDYHQVTHDMTEEHKDNDVHYCSHMATENRISGCHLDDTKPRGDLMSLENGIFSPSKCEHQSQRENYITLVSRYITDEIKCLEFLQCVVTRNIPHRYTEKTKQKTNTTYLGIIYANENTCDGMGKILETVHQYVPCYQVQGEKHFSSQAIVGDQLTVERGVNGLMDVSNGFTSEERREGLHFEIADFHGGIKFLELIYEAFYHPQSASDKCTLYCDRNLVDRRNVSTDVKHRVNQSKKFLNLAVKARVIAGALKLLDLRSVDDLPLQHMMQANERSTTEEKRNNLHSLASEIVDKFILRTEKVEHILNKVEAENEHEKQKAQKHFQCRFSGCGKVFKYDGKARREHEATHGMTHSVQPSKSSGARSGEHKRRCEKADLHKVVNELVEHDALTHKNGRKYKHFCNVNDSILDGFDMHAMFAWINEHKKKVLQKKCPR